MEDKSIGSFSIKSILRFKAPGPELENVTLEAFLFADGFYFDYRNGDIRIQNECLSRFIACLYYDETRFNYLTIDNHASEIDFVNIETRKKITDEYASIRLCLKNNYPYLFNLEEELQRIGKCERSFMRSLLLFSDYGFFSTKTFAHSPLNEAFKSLNHVIATCHSDPHKAALLLRSFSEYAPN